MTLLDFHRDLGYAAIAMNGLAGIYALVAWKVPKLRGRPVWIAVIVSEVGLMIQVVAGVLLFSWKDIEPPRIHMFYGFVVFIMVGLLYSYRYVFKARDQLEMFYGFSGLFLAGLGLRAVMQVM